MPSNFGKQIQKKERYRCMSIVEKYRDDLMTAWSRNPKASNATQVLRVVARLDAMLYEMSGLQPDNPAALAPVIVGGDFSMEEMAMAEEIIQQQERNPFED